MSRIYRFGLFEVNTTTRDLLRRGMNVRLQEQPFRVLLLFLENQGQVVTRDQLRQNLWSNDVYVEFDSSLRVAIGKLRDALGDEADNPRFIETVPRLGYRFIAPVQVTTAVAVAVAEPQAGPAIDHLSLPEVADVPVPPPQLKNRLIAWSAFFGLLFLIGISVIFWKLRGRQTKTLNDTDATLISTFANFTGDAAFDGVLKQALAVKLNESPFLNLVPDSRVDETLRYMKIQSDVSLAPNVWRDICQRTNAQAMLTGTIAPVGAHFLIGLEAIDCKTGDVLARDQVQSENKEGVLNALNHSADTLRVKLGESLRSVGQFDTPIQEATTSSLEALKSWNLGRLAAKSGEERSSIPLLKHATELDPNFASAYNELAITYFNLSELESARDNFRKAFDLRQHSSERERFNIESRYHQFVTGDLDKAIEVLQQWNRTYTKDAIPSGDLGAIYADLGKYHEAVEQSLEALRRMPNNYPAYQHLAIGYLGTNNLEQGLASHQKELAIWSASPFAHANLYAIAFVWNDAAAMDNEVASAAGIPDRQEAVLTSQALASAFQGRLKRAETIFEQAIAAAEKDKSTDEAAYILALRAQVEAEFGENGPANKHASAALQKSKDDGTVIVAATALARAGQQKRIEAIADRLSRENPQHTEIQKLGLPVIAATAILESDPPKAVGLLVPSLPYDLGMSGAIVPMNLSNPPTCPAYVRGRAYLQAGDAGKAAAEFQKIIDHRGVYMISPYYPLAYLGLGRAAALQGNAKNARAAYDQFFLLWKNGDHDIPILRDATQERAKLEARADR